MNEKTIEAIYPPSAQQQGMLFETLAAPRSGIHVEQVVCRLDGELDLSAFASAWQALLERHAVLRTAFAWRDQPQPLQIIVRGAAVPIAHEDWQGLAAAEIEERLRAFLAADRDQGFRLSKAPLMRLKLLRTAPSSRILVWTHHHVLMDGWCRPVLLRELFGLYEARCLARELELPPTRPYRDYAAWLSRQDTTQAEAYWRAALRGFHRPTPLGRPQPTAGAADAADAATAGGRFGGHTAHSALLPAAETRALLAWARTLRVTAATVVQAAWALLLSRYSGELDVVFAITVSGRPAELEGIESTIGLFINTLPLRVRIDPAAPAGAWLEKLQEQGVELRRHEHVAGAAVQRWSEVPAALPLYESILVFENYPDEAVETAAGTGLAIRFDGGFASGGRTRRPVTVLVTPGVELGFRLIHDSRRWRRGERVLQHLLALLRGFAADPEQSLAALAASIPAAEIPAFEPFARGGPAHQPMPPRSSTEELLVVLWRQVLGVEEVGVEDDFFDFGGHSLLATELVGLVREAFEVEVPLRALFEHPTVAALAAEIARLKGGQAEHEETVAALPALVPDPARRHQPFPLTELQEAYWVGRGDAFELGGVATHLYLEYEIERLEVERFERAWRQLVARHDMLRAVVLADGRQKILAEVPPYVVEVLDVRGDEPREALEKLLAVRAHMSHQVLAADRWPLFDIRASLLPGGTLRLHLSLDLLIGDAWSWMLLMQEMNVLLRAPAAALPPLELSFRDYVLALAALEQTPLHARALAYWTGRLAALPPGPELPLAVNPATIERPAFVRRQRVLPREAWSSLQRRAARRGLTPSGLLLAAFGEVLAAWSARPRFTINLTLFSRLPLHAQVNRIVGDFTSLTLLEIDAASAPTFEERARRLQRQLWDDLDHRAVGGVRVLRELARAGGGAARLAMPVVFTSTLGLSGAAGVVPDGGVDLGELRQVYGVSQTSQVWLDHQVSEREGELVFNWDAVDELFPAAMLDDMLAAYGALLERLAAEEEAWREIAPLALPAAHLALYAAANATAAPLPAGLLQGPFLTQAARQPERPAVISAARRLSYGELRRLAGGVALRVRRMRRVQQVGCLRGGGVETGSLVGVVMSKGWEQVVAVLGVLESGAAYLPIDAELPRQRRDELLRQGGVRLALTQPKWAAALEWPSEVKVLVLDETDGEILDGEVPDGAAVVEDIGGASLAYTLFTSGSTGVPKGVMIEHGAALNTIVDVNRRFAVGSLDRVLALSSLSFDLSVYDVFGLLGAGGAVVLPEAEAGRDPGRWLDLMASEGVTVWNTVPALLEMLVEHAAGRGLKMPASLRLVLLSGDWVPVGLAARLRGLCAGEVEVVSLGGATEASIWSILYPIGEVERSWRSIPYGRAMVNQTVEVLDSRLAPRPLWVAGDLYIGGAGLARGYWGDGEKTAASFVVHPQRGERLYRTGDLGRWLPDGNLEFLGRDDSQVKIHGHRIELGDIEAALSRCPGVEAAVVTAPPISQESPRQRRLAAYVVLSEDGRRELGGRQRGSQVSVLASPLARKGGAGGLRELPAAGVIDLPAEDLDAAAVEARYLSRRSFREFTGAPVAAADLGFLLACLRQRRLASHPLPKRRYGSAGSLYPVQVYLLVAEGRVAGLRGGTYYYHPGAHSLAPLMLGARLEPAAYAPVNRATYAASAFSLFLVGQMEAIVPVYGGERGRHFAVLEAGAIAQLLESSATAQGLGLCQIGDLDFAALRPFLDLDAGHELLHSMVGGCIDPASTTLRGFDEESRAYLDLLGLLEDRRGGNSASASVASVASVASEASVASAALGALLREKLPDYMVPATFTFLDSLPLTANGKIDRAALVASPALAASPVRPQGAGSRLPAAGVEEIIAVLWREVLHADQVGVDDNFFALGGHSVLLVRVYHRLRAALEREFPLVAMFEHPTVAALARYLSDEPPETVSVERSAERGDLRRESALRRRAAHRAPGSGDE